MKIQTNYTQRKDIKPGTIFTHRDSESRFLAIGGGQVFDGYPSEHLCINLNYPEDGVVFTHADEKCIILGNIQVEQ